LNQTNGKNPSVCTCELLVSGHILRRSKNAPAGLLIAPGFMGFPSGHMGMVDMFVVNLWWDSLKLGLRVVDQLFLLGRRTGREAVVGWIFSRQSQRRNWIFIR